MTSDLYSAGLTFARCAFTGPHAGPNGLPMDTNIYIYQSNASDNSSKWGSHKLKVWMTIVESGWNVWAWLVGGMYGCGYQEVGVVGRRRVWLAGGMHGCGYQEVGVVSRRRVWLAGGMYGCDYQEVGVVGNYWCG